MQTLKQLIKEFREGNKNDIQYDKGKWLGKSQDRKDIDRLLDAIDILIDGLEFYSDENKYFTKTRTVDPSKDLIFASRYDEEKGESVPVEIKEPFESKSYEVTARLKVDQGKTARKALQQADEKVSGA